MLKQFPRTKRHQRKQQNILAVRLKAYQNAHLCNQPFYNHFIYHCLIPCSSSCKMKWGFLCTVCTRLWVCNCLLEYFCCCHYVSACLWVCNCLLTHFFLLFFSLCVCTLVYNLVNYLLACSPPPPPPSPYGAFIQKHASTHYHIPFALPFTLLYISAVFESTYSYLLQHTSI